MAGLGFVHQSCVPSIITNICNVFLVVEMMLLIVQRRLASKYDFVSFNFSSF